jgi:hypothetical protein
LIDHDVGLLDLHLGTFEPQVLDIADDAHGADHAVDGDVLTLAAGRDRCGDAVLALLQAADRGGRQDLHALLLEGALGEGRDLLVLDGQDSVEHLRNRHLGAHGAIEARELDPDRTRPDHQE